MPFANICSISRDDLTVSTPRPFSVRADQALRTARQQLRTLIDQGNDATAVQGAAAQVKSLQDKLLIAAKLDELGVDYAAYLNGMGEAAGELRRYVLDIVRHGWSDRCEKILAAMRSVRLEQTSKTAE